MRQKLGPTEAWYAAEKYKWCAAPGSKRRRDQVHRMGGESAPAGLARARDLSAPFSTRRGRPDLAVLLGGASLAGCQVDSDEIGRPCRLDFPEESRAATGVVVDQRRTFKQDFYVVYFEPQDGRGAEYYEIALPPYDQFSLLPRGSAQVSERVAQMLPGGPALQEREVAVQLGEPAPLDYAAVRKQLAKSEVAAIQTVLRSGAKSVKRTQSVSLGYYPRAVYDATVAAATGTTKLVTVKRARPRWDSSKMSSYSEFEESVVRRSTYESRDDLLKLETIYGSSDFHMCLRGRPPPPGGKHVRIESDNPRDVQVLVKLIREYNFTTESLKLRITWRRIPHVSRADAHELRLGDFFEKEEAPADAPAWKHVHRDVEFVFEGTEYKIDEIYRDEDQDAVRAVNVRDATDVLELPAAEVEEIIERMLHPRGAPVPAAGPAPPPPPPPTAPP